ncbi:MAG: hypothetical protein WA715_18425 [Candidatus Acidiferrum sp.]
MFSGITRVPEKRKSESSCNPARTSGFPTRKFAARRFSSRLTLIAVAFAALLVAALTDTVGARADNNTFDLLGPRIEMKVSRNGKSLPISEVANLQPGDRLWLHPDFPDDQSARYLLIVAFLRGATNPPPESWFIKAETWSKPVREEGIVVTVPQEAQQAILFLAPETGGDFSSLRSAVRSRPGVFVRASQDLNQASLDRSRLEKYLADVKAINEADPKALKDHSILLARTLGIRVDEACFAKPLEEQSSCLTRNTENLVLDDGHSQSMVTALASGPNSDLVGAVSATSLAGGGFYSAYVGAVVDLARVLGNLHTASYVYIPALALPKKEEMNLKLNNPPSFRKPMSVIVVGLPTVEAAQLPPLRAVNAEGVFCLQKSSLVLPVEGAPLVFSSDIAHDFFFYVPGKDGQEIKLPARADASSGGVLVDTHSVEGLSLDGQVTGTLRGAWGFEPYEGPNFHLRTARSSTWTVPASEQSALIVGREDALHVQSDSAVCVDDIKIHDANGKEIKTTWKATKPDELELKVALKDQSAGAMRVQFRQFGLSKPDDLTVQAYSEAAHLDGFTINAGDQQGVLKGTRLDEVDHFDLNGVHFVPAKLTRSNEKDELHLAAAQPDPGALKPDQTVVAKVALKDGRVLDLQTKVNPARPKLALVSKNIQPGDTPSSITLGSQSELPLDGQISFLLKSEVPARFPRSERIEVATADESFATILNVSDGSLVMRDAETLYATINPRKSFGPSAFGPLQFRPIQDDGTKGDWQPLATLVRVPALKEIRCPESADKPCQLTGNNLFLIDSVASDQQFTHNAPVPTDFIDSTLSVPHPGDTGLFIKLRDDPSSVNTVTLPVAKLLEPPSTGSSSPAPSAEPATSSPSEPAPSAPQPPSEPVPAPQSQK